MSQFKNIDLPQGTVQYIELGQGQPIVFVHGLMVDIKLWQPLLPELSLRYRCILPNLPLGAHVVAMHPQADLSVPGVVRVIDDFINALDLHDVILVGNDTGGALAQMVCAQFPERIARLVLTTCDAYDVFPPLVFFPLKWLGHAPPLALFVFQLLHHIPVLRRLPFAFGDLTDAPLDNALIESWIAPLRSDAGVRRDVCKFLRSASTRYTRAAAMALQRFDKPVTLIWSTRCRHFPPRLAERFQKELPNVELHWINSAGVFLSLEHAGRVAAILAASAIIETAPIKRTASA